MHGTAKETYRPHAGNSIPLLSEYVPNSVGDKCSVRSLASFSHTDSSGSLLHGCLAYLPASARHGKMVRRERSGL